jgi:molybdopterin converting factor small subunit
MITVRLPATLRVGPTAELMLEGSIVSIAQLIDALDARLPGFKAQLDDSVFNFAVNDEILLQHVEARRLADGDIIEIIPTISGG